MTEPSEESYATDRRADAVAAGDSDADTDGSDAGPSAPESDDLEALRREVEETYDFDDFGPAEMAEMSLEEWEAAFDPDTWIVGEELLDRVEQELEARVAIREIFAVIERITEGEDRVVAYSDEGYAVIYDDGSVEGEGTVLRDVKPTVALCSMSDYELMDAPEDASLPEPEEVVEGSGEFGNLMLQIVAGVQILVGVGILIAWLALPSLSTVVAPIASFGFLVIGAFLFFVVANARLSDRFRTEEFRARLRALDAADDEPPEAVAEVMPDAGAETDAAVDSAASGNGTETDRTDG
ncbi:DUF7319 domain-containing protein [Halobellus sp. EA9]|uniref:DUF7319 domain-containing protein n=1 Tax=Halobellus sp. EA9 TaxID=3421647 RepID=UPI003EC1206E